MKIDGYSMGYCLFQNVLKDLGHIKQAFDQTYSLDELSPDEERAYHRALEICKEIAENHG